ncbi:hypothetical protein DYU11_09545 [Fibrisoma montanum]|uniref:Uncharacterized protein n=1 Tax=Fibrisoma montanum TaxID=2305895 RepID=A0A418MFF6_9BACT|nr:hypothetical protein [Fibrisoma montanum]RIV25530.1 hypothetical protein DYU11_09545 [Fibrisoma montanum]
MKLATCACTWFRAKSKPFPVLRTSAGGTVVARPAFPATSGQFSRPVFTDEPAGDGKGTGLCFAEAGRRKTGRQAIVIVGDDPANPILFQENAVK